jgi:hypothetical protein
MKLQFLIYHAPDERDDAFERVRSCSETICDELEEPDEFKATFRLANGSTPKLTYLIAEDIPPDDRDVLESIALSRGILLLEVCDEPVAQR